jgi:hypothetical protein
MKYVLLSLAACLLTLPACFHAGGGAPLPPEIEAKLAAMPKSPPNAPQWYIDDAAISRQFGLPASPPQNTPYPQRKDMFDNAGNHTGYMTNDGSSGIWSIYDKAGNYQGRVNDGVIYNNRGDYIGQIR